MSYRSKRTFLAANEDAPIPQKKQAPPTPGLPVSQSSNPPFDPSVNKWGPFTPPTLKTFGSISQPIKPSTTTKKATTFMSSSSMVASQSSMPQSTSIQSNPYLETSKPLTTPTSVSASGGTLPQKSVAQSRPPYSPMIANTLHTSTQLPHNANLLSHKPTQQPPLHTTPQVPHNAASLPHKQSQQPLLHAATQVPHKAPMLGKLKLAEKKSIAATTGATKPMMSEGTPPLGIDKNPHGNLNFSEPIHPFHTNPAQAYMHASETTFYGEQSPSFVHVEYEARQDSNNEESSSSESDEELDVEGNKVSNMKKSAPSKPRRRIVVPNWSDNVKFDEKDEVKVIDADGKQFLVKGPVHPRDVWIDNELKYVVHFNDYNQPLRKGGSILVSFINDIAKREKFCPVGVKSWHKLNKKFKTDVVKVVWKHFVIPGGELFNKAILKRTSKSWKHFRYILKRDNFDPKMSTDQNYKNIPDGVSRQNWMNLVDYWLSAEGQKLSELGKDARASLAHTHISGATSFANRRVDLEEEKGEFSELDFYQSVYVKKDGSCKEGTLSRQFMEDAKMKVKENLATSSSKSRVEIENAVFNELMYKGEVPKRPLNYGFGVKQSDIFGVQGLLRKEGLNHANNSVVEVENLKLELSTVKKRNEDLEEKIDETNKTFKMVASHLAEILKEVRNGNASSEVLDGAEAAINMVNSEIPDVPRGNGIQ